MRTSTVKPGARTNSVRSTTLPAKVSGVASADQPLGTKRGPSARKQPQPAPLWAAYPLQRASAETEWFGRNIKLSEAVLPLIQGIFNETDSPHLRMRHKHLQINLRHEQPADPFRWGLLKEIIQSGQELVIELSNLYQYAWHQETDGKIASEEKTATLEIDGVTLASQILTKQTYGKLVGMTSTEEHISAIYLQPNMATPNKMAHELLGHFYLDVRNIPSGHAAMLTAAQRVLDPSGNPFTGRVHDFIQQHIEFDGVIDPYDPIFYE